MVVIDVIENIYQNQNDGKLCAGDLYHQLMIQIFSFLMKMSRVLREWQFIHSIQALNNWFIANKLSMNISKHAT